MGSHWASAAGEKLLLAALLTTARPAAAQRVTELGVVAMATAADPALVVGGPVEQGYLVVAIGLEGRPGARAGWFVEAGVGGGARLALGYRWRQLPAAWPGQ